MNAKRSGIHSLNPLPPLGSRKWWPVLILLWLSLVCASAFWNHIAAREHAFEVARSTLRAFFDEIQTTRQWNAEHGGVYVPVTEQTQPNPYLDVSHRDVSTTDGEVVCFAGND